MKKTLVILISVFALLCAGFVFANPAVASSVQPVGDYLLYSSDSNEITQVKGVLDATGKNVGLQSLPAIPGWFISGLNDDLSQPKLERTCPFCWVFAIGFALWLIAYGVWLGVNRPQKHWFRLPLFVGIFVYLAHGAVHVLLASPIFLYYYWMVIFDELVVAAVVYSLILHPPRIHFVRKTIYS